MQSVLSVFLGTPAVELCDSVWTELDKHGMEGSPFYTQFNKKTQKRLAVEVPVIEQSLEMTVDQIEERARKLCELCSAGFQGVVMYYNCGGTTGSTLSCQVAESFADIFPRTVKIAFSMAPLIDEHSAVKHDLYETFNFARSFCKTQESVDLTVLMQPHKLATLAASVPDTNEIFEPACTGVNKFMAQLISGVLFPKPVESFEIQRLGSLPCSQLI